MQFPDSNRTSQNSCNILNLPPSINTQLLFLEDLRVFPILTLWQSSDKAQCLIQRALLTELPETQQQAGTLGKVCVWWKEQSRTSESYKLHRVRHWV